MKRNDLIDALAKGLGSASVLTGERLELRQTRDWSDAGAAQPLALLLPRTTGEVAEALRICSEHGCSVAVQGGLTGLAGGANPLDGEVALSLSRLDRIEEVDAVAGIAVVQAGVTLERLQQACAEHGWTFPLDLGARGSCQVGGNAATNAGGNRVLRYGMMRNLILGLEVVLADGTVLTMLDRVIKNNAGFDLKQLFIGSEGSLGVITRLSLMLAPEPAQRCTVLCGMQSFDDALELLRSSKSSLQGLSAFEVMWASYFDASMEAQGKTSPLAARYPVYTLVESVAGAGMAANESMEAFLEQAIESGLVADAVVAQTGTQQDDLWAIREGVSELLAVAKPCAAFDVSVAITRMDELVHRLEDQLKREFPGQKHLFFGHLGDGNLHLISGPYPDPKHLERAEELVYGCVGLFQGSISAEHGIGVVKRDFLHHSRAQAEIDLMRRLKVMLDPQGTLNPGRVFPLSAGVA
ncbi:FAD/FMN-containing dehydrogenase [Variovorax sp. HW608]|uniref:FAD-binding oxidoreductase n=1 Tax=Variovorax sp. HW608 TaxID=1034889 RepID=UPI00081F8907|nr:FAD-binding oxidoreductase [Variovorax sp. HW608]SCK15467.1 FAD/FMN-containing dehydrogenase [Variovorax sp. HW608]